MVQTLCQVEMAKGYELSRQGGPEASRIGSLIQSLILKEDRVDRITMDEVDKDDGVMLSDGEEEYNAMNALQCLWCHIQVQS